MGKSKSFEISLISFFSIEDALIHFSLLQLELNLTNGYFINRALVDYYKDSEGRSNISLLFGLINL